MKIFGIEISVKKAEPENKNSEAEANIEPQPEHISPFLFDDDEQWDISEFMNSVN